MQIRKTSALVEAGILAAIEVVFALVGSYVPVLSLFADFLLPLPIALCGQRNGFKWSLGSLLVAAMIIAIIVNPVQALSVVAVFGLIGLTVGYCMHRRLSPVKLLLFGSLSGLVAIGFSFLIGYLVLGINMIQMMLDSMQQGHQMVLEFYAKMGYSAEQMAAMTQELSTMTQMMVMILPAAFVIVAPLLVFLNYWAARKILGKMGIQYPWFPPFMEWSVPRWSLLLYGAGLIMVMGFQVDQTTIGYKIGFNLFVFSSLLLLLQGVSVLKWYVVTKNKPRWWFSVAIVIIFMSSFLSQIISLLGAYDMLFDFRKLHPGRRTLGRK